MSQLAAGLLVVRENDEKVLQVALVEGAAVQSEINGRPFVFTLERLPNPYDIREMSAVQIAEYLAQRIREDADERRWSAMGEDL